MPIFKANMRGSMIKFESGRIEIQPPMNITTVKALIKIIELYSARKKSANPILAYSTLYPETSSDSASGRSNGALFVSAKILTRNIINNGNRGNIKKTKFWKQTMSTKFSDPTHNKEEIRINPIETS
jgi:hypothetical protein